MRNLLSATREKPAERISEVIDISPGNLDSSVCFFQPNIALPLCTQETKRLGLGR